MHEEHSERPMARLWNRKDWSLRLSQERGHVAEGAAWKGYDFWGLHVGALLSEVSQNHSVNWNSKVDMMEDGGSLLHH